MKLVYTMPFLLRSTKETLLYDVIMAKKCIATLQGDEDVHLIVYNQGMITNKNVADFLSDFNISFEVLGNGTNVGIPKARQEMFKYIWTKYKDVLYICEIHLDMIFYYKWYEPLIEFLGLNDEPMICPGIINKLGELQPNTNDAKKIMLPNEVEKISNILRSIHEDRVEELFVHPVIHKSEILKEIGGYDDRFLIGKQGYEDDSLLLGYLYYMGLRSGWRPKCYLKARVYHETLTQRMSLEDLNEEVIKNRAGLLSQYGAYGFKELAKIHNNSKFEKDFNKIVKGLNDQYKK